MTNDWTLNGDYLEPCNCDVAWRCSWMEAPDDGVCTVSLTWHIQEGSHGDIDLSGLHATWPANCADGNPFGPGVTWP